jgi:hypothetical protein
LANPRLALQVTGVTFTPTDAIAMLQLCSYETHALGYSAFCGLFTQQDFLHYEYYYDLVCCPPLWIVELTRG